MKTREGEVGELGQGRGKTGIGPLLSRCNRNMHSNAGKARHGEYMWTWRDFCVVFA